MKLEEIELRIIQLKRRLDNHSSKVNELIQYAHKEEMIRSVMQKSDAKEFHKVKIYNS
ncbi:MAG: hypothetical protein NZM38_06810 [Cytophagales bacterium]|nr:hypothetical protein [Cytophagales bacterium]MDW8384467.1 hypothetical protein [Flammeovirgaceae bacterium]